MTPERRKEIRAEIDGWGDTMPYHLRLAQELLAEVDRLEATTAALRKRLGGASLAIHYAQHQGPYARCARESCRLDRELVERQLDSPPATKGHP